MENVVSYIKSNQKRYVDEMVELLKIESVSADSKKSAEVRRCGEVLVKRLKDAGFENAKLCETGGHPAVYADWLHAKGKPTVLVYGHYDVQPVDPIEKWSTPPFTPTIKGNSIFARGSSDDKGQLLTHFFALEAFLKNGGKLPCNVKFFLEGEEEGGTGSTDKFVENNRDLLSCDTVVMSDTAWHEEKVPSLCYALRGLAYFDVLVKGPNRDLHSGVYGGKIQNPLNAMAKIIAKLQDENGVIQVPGFYDDVVQLSSSEKKEFASLGDPDPEMKKDLGIPATWGEKGYTTLERNWGRPSFDVHGIWGGFTGEGSKTVITSDGGFKFSTRLVANQDPKKIEKLVVDYVNKICPPGVTCDVKMLHGAYPVMVPIDNFYIKSAVGAFEKAFGKRPVLVREGASIPITATFLKALKAPSVLIGYGLPDDNIHSPNEKFNLENFQKGILTNAYMYDEFGKK